MDHRVYLDLKETKDILDLQDLLVCQDYEDSLVFRERKEREDL